MVVNIQNIGNSKGIILPKQLITLCSIEDRVNIEVEDNHLIISPVHEPRSGWDAQFKSVISKEKTTDADIFDGLNNTFDDTEWTW